MLRYSRIKGFINIGKQKPHLYEWVEKLPKDCKVKPQIILVYAYDGEPIVYRGYAFDKEAKYMPVHINDIELKNVIKMVGNVKHITDFNEFNKIAKISSKEFTLEKLLEVEEDK